MKADKKLVEQLFHACLQKSGTSNDRMSLTAAAATINNELPESYKKIGGRYLYETISRGLDKADRARLPTLSLQQAALDTLAYYVGYASFQAFQARHRPTVPPELLGLQGNWYSIVRCNSGRPQILVSPVTIRVAHDNLGVIELYGPDRTYTGTIKWIGGSISCYLESDDTQKALYLAFKVGVVKRARLLLGVFSAVASSGNPISGKEVLWRSDATLADMHNEIIKLDDYATPYKVAVPRVIQRYFTHFEETNIKIDQSSTFDLDDV